MAIQIADDTMTVEIGNRVVATDHFSANTAGKRSGRSLTGQDRTKWEVRAELAPEYWGRGLATEGSREAIRFG